MSKTHHPQARRSAALPAPSSSPLPPRLAWRAGRGWHRPEPVASGTPLTGYMPPWLRKHVHLIRVPGGIAIEDALAPDPANMANDPYRALALENVRAQIDLLRRMLDQANG